MESVFVRVLRQTGTLQQGIRQVHGRLRCLCQRKLASHSGAGSCEYLISAARFGEHDRRDAQIKTTPPALPLVSTYTFGRIAFAPYSFLGFEGIGNQSRLSQIHTIEVRRACLPLLRLLPCLRVIPLLPR